MITFQAIYPLTTHNAMLSYSMKVFILQVLPLTHQASALHEINARSDKKMPLKHTWDNFGQAKKLTPPRCQFHHRTQQKP